MPTVTTTDANLIARAKRCAFIAWLTALIFGLLSWGARALDLDGVASNLLLVVWIAGAAFVICWAFLVVSAFILLVNKFSGRSGGA